MISNRKLLITILLSAFMLHSCSKKTSSSNVNGNITVTVSTVAGNGTAGYVDGPGANATFKTPWGIAVDNSGNIYVADHGNNRIRKIGSSGQVTTFAGSGSLDFADGSGTNAMFNGLNDMTTDSQGNLYVTDQNNERIRKITPQGQVTTVAGNGILGNVNGPAANAEFNGPSSVAIDLAGNIYVTDQFNNLIKKISNSGIVSTLAGSSQGFADGTGTNAQFSGPNGIAVDAQGNVYISDQLNRRIRKITPAGVVSTIAGNGLSGSVDGPGSIAEFGGTLGLAIDSQNNLYVGDAANNTIRKITPAGVVSTLAGTGTAGFRDGSGSIAQFNFPWGVAVDGNGNVYAADARNNSIRKITQ